MIAVRRGGINSYWPQNFLQRSVDGAREWSSVERPGERAVGGMGDCELLKGRTVILGPYCCQVDGALNSRANPRRSLKEEIEDLQRWWHWRESQIDQPHSVDIGKRR